ncbi:hypothetical protein EDD99_0086 [Streptomyces sp. 846.5]|nr:hypothetical protein EDD99_0086 [Streptomyces sp. 846.5]
MADGAGRDTVEAVAHGVRFGVGQVVRVVQGEEADPAFTSWPRFAVSLQLR